MTLSEALRILKPTVGEPDADQQQARELIYAELNRLVRPVLRKDRDTCQDIASQAFLKLMAAGGRGVMDSLPESEPAARAYLAQVLRRTFYDGVRAPVEQRSEEFDPEAGEDAAGDWDPHGTLVHRELRDAIGRARAYLDGVVAQELAAKMREPYGRTFVGTMSQLLQVAFDETTVDDIVVRLHGGVTKQARNAVDQQHSRARKRLAEWYAEVAPEREMDGWMREGLRILMERLRPRGRRGDPDATGGEGGTRP